MKESFAHQKLYRGKIEREASYLALSLEYPPDETTLKTFIMSKKAFKSHASSSRAASGVSAFGGFGSTSTGTLSYLTEPPNISSITDPNVVVAFKNLSKKDPTTKSKALEDLKSYVQANPFEKDGGVEEPLLEAWVCFTWDICYLAFN